MTVGARFSPSLARTMGVACRADLGTRKLGRGFPSQLQLPTLIYLYLKFALRPRSCGQRQHLWFHRFHPASTPSELGRATLRRRYCSRIVHASPARRNSSLTSLARSLWAWLAGWQWVGYGLWNMGWKSSEIQLRALRCFTLPLSMCGFRVSPSQLPFQLARDFDERR